VLRHPAQRARPESESSAISRSKKGERFQNYRAKLTVLDTGTVSREWIEAVRQGDPLHDRTREEQQAAKGRDESLVQCIYGYFKDNPHGFEHCAARLAALMDPNIKIEMVTRPSVDGGRDAIGIYRVGPLTDRISLDFALEATCHAPENGVGVKELSSLISRLRHRQFGILVTTSFLGHQAYQELRSDRHPVVVISGADIAAILVKAGLGTPEAVREWLVAEFQTAGQLDLWSDRYHSKLTIPTKEVLPHWSLPRWEADPQSHARISVLIRRGAATQAFAGVSSLAGAPRFCSVAVRPQPSVQ
jgi:hypothetical protein